VCVCVSVRVGSCLPYFESVFVFLFWFLVGTKKGKTRKVCCSGNSETGVRVDVYSS